MKISILVLLILSVTCSSGLVRVPLTRFKEYTYFMNITLGSPPQYFRMICDTSTKLSWVPSSIFTLDGCFGLNFYNNSASDHDRITYSTNQLNFTNDIVTMNGLVPRNMKFLEMKTVPMAQCIRPQYDGVLGLADSNNALGYRASFSFYMKRNLSSEDGGEMVIGDTDPDKYFGSFRYIPLLDNEKWMVMIDKVEVNGIYICTYCEAMVNTGQSAVTAPSEFYDDLMYIIDNSYFVTDNPPISNLPGITFFNCKNIKSYPPIFFTMRGLTLELSPEEYLIPTKEVNIFPGHTCYANIFEGSKGDEKWMLGNLLIGKFYTTFEIRKNRIGFARLKTKYRT